MSARVALIGYGLAGEAFHAPLIAAEPGLELAAVVTRDPKRRAAAAARHPGVELLQAADEIWARAGAFDLAVVASPNATHVALARAALDAGLHVVVDKPLAASAAEAAALTAHAEARGRLLVPFHNRRWDGDFRTLQRLVASGALGQVARLESRFERWRPEVAAGRWRESAAPQDAGGLLYDLGVHLIDQALVLFGPAASVYAELDRRRTGARVDDDAFVAITHRSGVRSHLWASMIAGALGPRLRALGTAAAYVKHGLDVQEAQLRNGLTPHDPGFGVEEAAAHGALHAGGQARPVATEPGRYQDFYAGVAAAIAGGAPPPVGPQDAIAALEVIDAARTSAAEGRVVTLASAAPA
jgi:predicted dehydrogenase